MPTKSADHWFSEYGESHQNGVNKLLHWICVPLIAACVIALLWDVPTPAFIERVPLVNWSTLLVAAALIFYVRLSPPLAIGMFAFSTAAIGLIIAYERLGITPVWQAALVVFALAWVGQFIGHSIEGKKPSFFQDLQFLLIGPIWLLAFIYRKLGIPY
jgi:uncharacterized membrane protein YGL010W